MGLAHLLQELRSLLDEEFDQWLAPEVVDLLVREYAQPGGPGMGRLRWEYVASLGSHTLGRYNPPSMTLQVAKSKSKEKFKQQVNTILHEIEHWNQHVEASHRAQASGTTGHNLNRQEYKRELATKGYRDNKFEVGARAFADRNVDGALTKISNLLGNKVEGTLDDVVEELFDEYESVGKVTRLQIGQALRDRGLNTPANMAEVIRLLKELELKVAA
jgi:hypothetical protein